jgi:hypothetical protein
MYEMQKPVMHGLRLMYQTALRGAVATLNVRNCNINSLQSKPLM